MESNNRAKTGLLQPLEIPSKKRAHVTTDLVTELPKSNGFTAIVVFIGKLTKMAHLAKCKKEVIAMEYAQIFIDNVFWLCGLQRSLYLTKIHVSLSSSGVHYSTCSGWISSSILHFICTLMVSRADCGGVVGFTAATSPAMSFTEMVWRMRSDLQTLNTTRQHTPPLPTGSQKGQERKSGVTRTQAALLPETEITNLNSLQIW